MRNQGLGSWPERRLRMSPDRPAILFEDTTTSYATLADRVRRCADALHGLGLRRGDRVVYLGTNHPSSLETLFACGALGAIWVPVNARLTPPEVAYVLGDSAPSVVVHGREHGGHADALADGIPWVAAEPPLDGGAGSLHYEDLLAAAEPVHRDVPVGLDDPCMIMYTSGTTGRPKGAVLTHGNITFNCVNQLIGLDFAPAEVTLAVAPLFHIGGLNGTVTPTLMRGGTVLIVRSFDAPRVLELVERHGVNSFFAVPAIIEMLARDPGFTRRDLSALRTVGVGGAPLPPSSITPWHDRGVTIQQVYGMTEAAPSGTSLDGDEAAKHIGSAGRQAFFTDVRVWDEAGRDVEPGQVGEVVLSGPNIMSGYWGQPEATAEVLRDGWFHSGDAASVDEDGYLYIRDRFKDMIISGGENVYPAEVEAALMELPGVVEAAVIGVPDEKWGEVGMAVLVVVGEANADVLLGELRGRLAGFKIPRHVRFVEALPRTATGKIRKAELRRSHP
ncbi:MAG: fatty-acyl-CoA synthase [Pseudonocardiales bacterium]|nr:fatty-acyl-CoA synthase [Pseudonocardiales bacterium]